MSNTEHTKSYLDDTYAMSYPETHAFWEASASGRFLVKTCQTCNKAHWYPRIVCPLCGGSETDWQEASGNATLFSYSLMEKADPPYALAWVELEEGPIMITNIVDCDFSQLKIGQALKVRFRQCPEGRYMPVFLPK